MAGKYKIVMVRHGESEWNEKNLFCGWFDANLSESGKWDTALGLFEVCMPALGPASHVQTPCFGCGSVGVLRKHALGFYIFRKHIVAYIQSVHIIVYIVFVLEKTVPIKYTIHAKLCTFYISMICYADVQHLNSI